MPDDELEIRRGFPAEIKLFALASVVLAVSLLPSWMAHSTNSDDTYLSAILRTWRPFNDHVTRVRDDTYLLHWPFYWLADNVFGQSRSTLLIVSMSMNLVSLWLVLRFVLFVVRRLTADGRIVWLATGSAALWYASTAGPAADLLVRPSFRNLELGLLLAVIQLAIETAERPVLSSWRCIMVAGLSGLLMVDDPLHIYLILAVVVIVGLRSLGVRRGQGGSVTPVFLLAGGFVFYLALRLLLGLVGFKVIAVPATVIPLSDAWASISNTAHWLLDLLSADVFDREVKNLTTLLTALRLALLAGVGWLAYQSHQRGWVGDLAVQIPAAAFSAVLLASVFSTNGLYAGNGRYLALCVPLVAVAIAFVVVRSGGSFRAVVLAAVAIVSIFNIVLSIRDLHASRGSDPDRESLGIIAQLEAANLTHGYGGYWESYTYTYLSDGRVEILEVACTEGTTTINYGDTSQYRRNQETSFFLFDPRDGVGTCGIEDIERQFGPPVKRLQLSDTKVALVFDFDLGSMITGYAE